MIFQDPISSLHPLYKVGWQIVEAIRAHEDVSKEAARRRALEALDRVGIPNARGAARQLPARALRRHAPARDDRDGARPRSGGADRGRADDGARRHRPGADPRSDRRAAGGARDGRRPHHPRPRRRGRDGRRRRRHVRGPGGRARAGAVASGGARAPVHLGPPRVDAARRGPRCPPAPDPGPAAQPDQRAERLPVPSALPARVCRLPARRAAAPLSAPGHTVACHLAPALRRRIGGALADGAVRMEEAS